MRHITKLKANQRGFSHLILPIIAVLAVALVGTYLIHDSRAASTPYSGECTPTIISTSTVVTTSKYKTCIIEAQELLDGIQRENYDSYKTAVKSVPYTTAVGSSYYLLMNGIYSTATAYAVKALPGNGTNNALTNGTTNGTWQILCSDAVSAGLATGGKAASYILNLNSNAYDVETNAAIFKTTCGNLPSTTSSGGGSTSTANKGTLPSGSTYGGNANALAQWNTALKDRTTQAATWVAWGDSITEGQGSTTVAGRWINQTLTTLRTKYPISGVTGGFGYVPSFYNTYNAGSGEDSDWSTDPVLSGSASENTANDGAPDGGQELGNGAGLGLRTVTLKSGGSETFKVSGSSIDIMYNYGSGSFSYKVDSGAATTIATTGGTGATGSKHVAFSSTGSHTVTISGVSGSVILEGIMVYSGDETKGIHLYDSAQSAITTPDYLKQATNVAAITANVKADLVTIELGANDFGRGGATPTQTTANLKTMVADIRNASKSHEPSIVIVVVYPNTGTGTLGYPWSSYESAIKAVTSADPTLGLLDLTSFGTAGKAGGVIATDGIHPSNAGQTKLAQMVSGYLEDE